jgi:hypothetical protein
MRAPEAAQMFVVLPDYPSIELWKQNRLNKLAAGATEECKLAGTKACARVALTRYNIKAAAFKRLVSSMELQNAFMALLNYWEHVAWDEFIGSGGTPKEIRSGSPSIAPGLARRKRWWIRQGYKQLEIRRPQRQKELTNLRSPQNVLILWQNFSLERTSKTSKFRDLLIYALVNSSVPAPLTHRDVVQQIAEKSQIPIESLPAELSQPVFSRGRPIFGYAGNEFDKIADEYPNMQWWLSDIGLNMAIVKPPNPVSIPTFDELIGELTQVPAGTRIRTRHGKTNPVVQRIKKRTLELRKAGLDYSSICDRLASTERPPRAAWRDFSWPVAYKRHTSAVTKWLSEACADLPPQMRQG